MKEFTKEQMKRVREFATMSDSDFYDKFLSDAPLEEVAAFLEEFPDFMSDEKVKEIDADEILRKIMEQAGEEYYIILSQSNGSIRNMKKLQNSGLSDNCEP